MVTNADGSEKLDPIVIGHGKIPVAFRNAKINPNNLPAVYHYNRKAWMPSGIWFEFLIKLNQQMADQNRRETLDDWGHPVTIKILRKFGQSPSWDVFLLKGVYYHLCTYTRGPPILWGGMRLPKLKRRLPFLVKNWVD